MKISTLNGFTVKEEIIKRELEKSNISDIIE